MDFKNMTEEELLQVAVANNLLAPLTRSAKNGLARKLENHLTKKYTLINPFLQKAAPVFKPPSQPTGIIIDSVILNNNPIETPIAIGGSFMCKIYTKVDYKSNF